MHKGQKYNFPNGLILFYLLKNYLYDHRQKKKGRNARWITQYKQDMKDFVTADTVQDCIEHGIKWDDVYGVASELLNGTFAEGTEFAIEKKLKHRDASHIILPHLPIYYKTYG